MFAFVKMVTKIRRRYASLRPDISFRKETGRRRTVFLRFSYEKVDYDDSLFRFSKIMQQLAAVVKDLGGSEWIA